MVALAGGLEERFAELTRLLEPVLAQCDLRSNAEAYVRALLVPGVAGNCWALAQAVGHARPSLLARGLDDQFGDRLRPSGAEVLQPALRGLRSCPPLTGSENTSFKGVTVMAAVTLRHDPPSIRPLGQFP